MLLRWVRAPPMPGIGCLGKFCIRCPGNLEIRIFGFPVIRIFGNLEVRKSENPDFRISENPKCRYSDFRNSGNFKNPDFRIFRFPGFSENRQIQKSSKKASDVEFAYVALPLKSMVIEKGLRNLQKQRRVHFTLKT